MPESGRVAWRRLTAEAAAIVFSILVAFAIDAAWDARGNRTAESEILASLADEFEGNRVLVAAAESAVRRSMDDLARLMVLHADSIDDLDVATALRLMGAAGAYDPFDPISAELQSVLASGRFGLINSDSRRTALSGWAALLEDAESMTATLQLRTESLMEVFGRYGAGQTFASLQLGVGSGPAPQAVIAAVRSDADFLNRAAVVLLSRDLYLREDLQAFNVSLGAVGRLIAKRRDELR